MQTPVHVDVWYDDDWHDLTDEDRVYTRDPITITRGRARERERVAPSLMNLSIKNNDGKYSIRNPMSELWGRISRNQPVRCWCRLFLDDFGNRTQSGWGFASDGRGWATTGVGTGSFAVGSGVGTQIQTTAAGYRLAFLTGDPENLWRDCEIRVRFSLSGTGMPNVAGGSVEPANLALRLVDATNYYFLRVEITTAEAVNISIKKIVANVETTLSSVVLVTGLTFSGQALMASFQAEGSVLSGKVWDPAAGEPFDWQVTAVDTTFPNAGVPGIRTGAATGNTNVPVVASYDNYELRVPRVYAEVESWPQRWTVDANEDGTRGDVWAPVKCNGLMRRLGGVGSKARELSSMRRFMDQQSPLAYWALDAGQLSTVGKLTSGSGSEFTPLVGSTKFGSGELAPWLEQGVSFNESASFVASPMATATPARMVVDVLRRADGGGSGPSVLTFRSSQIASGAYTIWIFTFTPGTFDEIDVTMLSNTTNDTAGPTAVPSAFTNDLIHIRFDGAQVGGDIVWSLTINGVQVLADTWAGATLRGLADSIQLSYNPGSSPSPIAFGHVAYWEGTPSDLSDTVDAAFGYQGEQAHERIERVCNEEGVAVATIGDESSTLGPQPIASTPDILHDAADTDGGILFEPRGTFGLAYKTHTSLLNQLRAVTLDYAAGGEVAPPLDPTEDTDHVQNDVTVTKVDGGSSHVVQETGSLNVQEPADDQEGVGRYPVDVQLNLETDAQTLQQAAWVKHLGTWDEPRYPAVTMDLTAMDADHKTALINEAVALDIGDRLGVENPPMWQGPDDVDQHAQGYAETLASHRWTLESNTTPAGPWLTGVLDTARLDNPDCIITRGLHLPGSSGDYASTPDTAALDITGDIDLRAELTLPDWTPSTVLAAITKWSSTNNRSYFLMIRTGGEIGLSWSTDGTTVVGGGATVSTTAVPFANGERGAIRATLDVDNGASGHDVKFYTGPTVDGPWTQLGSTVTRSGTTSIFSGNLPVEVGGQMSGTLDRLTGTVHAVQVYNGIDGTLVADARFQEQTAGTTSFVDVAGRTWTVNGTAQIVATPGITSTTMLVASPTVRWTSTTPYDVVAGGERMTVTSVTGSSNTQILTVTRSVNGVQKSHAVGTKVHTYQPLRMARGA